MDVVIPPNVNSYADGSKGIFKHMHYSVDANGPNTSVRRHHLTKIFDATFKTQPGAPNAKYVATFGEPKSKERYDKMQNFLESHSNRYKNQTTQGWIDCVEKWDDDSVWLENTFGINFYDYE